MLTLAQLGAFVAEHHHQDLFRLETLSRYLSDSDGDDFGRYLRGEPEPSSEAKGPWRDRLRSDTEAGRRWRKVHLVGSPITDYERYEFEWGFAYNVTAGEQIRIGELSPALRRVGDYFVLDHHHVIRSHYDGDGRFVGATVADDPAPFIALADLLWERAQDFSTWWDQHQEYHRGSGSAA